MALQTQFFKDILSKNSTLSTIFKSIHSKFRKFPKLYQGQQLKLTHQEEQVGKSLIKADAQLLKEKLRLEWLKTLN